MKNVNTIYLLFGYILYIYTYIYVGTYVILHITSHCFYNLENVFVCDDKNENECESLSLVNIFILLFHNAHVSKF